MADPNILLAQIGCGYWGPNLLRSFSALPGCRVKYVVDSTPERRAYVTSNFSQVEAIPDWKPAFEDPAVQAVVIATPAATHFEIAKAALEAGKDVFVEKPLALTTQQAEDLGSLAAAGKRILMVGHTFLYNGAVRYVKKMLEEGQLGELYYIYSQRLNLGQVRTDVNSWWNLAPHDVSILLYLMNGELPKSVSVHGLDYIQRGVEDVTFAALHWGRRMMANIHVSWLDPGRVRRMTLVGSRKMVVYDDISDDKIAIYDKGIDRLSPGGGKLDYDDSGRSQLLQRSGDVWLPRIRMEEPLKVEAAHFLDCIRTRQAPMTGPAHARDVIRVLEAGDRSLREHVPVSLS
jgi:predicted dehydrogenase